MPSTPVAWPAGLPQEPASYSEQDKDIVVRTQPDSGPTKGRLRFTKAGTLGQMEFLFTIAQRETMRYFYETQLKRGSIQMVFKHPWTNLSTIMTITQPPKYVSDGPLGVRASFPVEFFAAAAASPTAGQIVLSAVQTMAPLTQQGLIDTTNARHVSASQTVPGISMSAQGRAFVRTSAAQAVQQLIQNATLVAGALSGMMVGMNVGGTNDYGANQPFANLCRNMRTWQRVDDGSFSYWTGQDQGRITGATSERFMSVVLAFDANIPSQTLRVLNPNGNAIFVSGGYGDPGAGVFTTATSFNYVYTNGENVFLYAQGNVSGTLAILLAGHETSYNAGNEWSSDFLNFHTTLGTKVLRFMDGSAGNTTLDQVWADRSVTGKISFQASGGIQIPYELQADLCNRLGCDMWVTVPARASTSGYTPSLAALLFATLNTARKVYVERGNEIWNTGNTAFSMNTEWIRRIGHTRFNFTCSGTTFTKTAHGFSNDQRLQPFASRAVQFAGVGSETQLASASWATGVSYTAGQYVYDPSGNSVVCLTSHTSGTYATDLAAGKWQAVLWYPMVAGGILRIKVLTANTFELWTGVGGTGTKMAAPAGLGSTPMIGILSDEFGVIADEFAALNTSYGALCLSDWTAFDTAFGGTTRVKATLGSQAANPAYTGPRIAATGVAARCNHVHIAPYHDGFGWGGKVVPAAGKITPYGWSTATDSPGTMHCTVYTAGSTPTLAQRKAGTGTGFQNRCTPFSVWLGGPAGGYTQGADITVADGTYKVYQDMVDFDGLTWTVSQTVVIGAGQPTVNFIDTDANQAIRELYDIQKGDLLFIGQHLSQIAASTNPGITLINYEGGSHEDKYPPSGSALETWMSAYRESVTYGDTLRRYYYCLAAAGVKLHCHYQDVSGKGITTAGDTPWRIASSYADVTDKRFLAVSAFGGVTPARTRVDFGIVNGGSIPTVPGAFPSTFYTFSDTSLTYQIVGGDEDGNYAISGANVRIVAQNNINWAVVQDHTLKIMASDGYTHDFFDFVFTTNAYPTSSFDPSTLFTSAQKGFWYDPADMSTLFQDTAGTTPVTAVGQTVGKMLDKSGNGAHLIFGSTKPALNYTAGTYSLVANGGGQGGQTAATLNPGGSSLGTVCIGLRKGAGADAFGTDGIPLCFGDWTGSGNKCFEICAPDFQSASGSKGFGIQLLDGAFVAVATKYVSSLPDPITRVVTATFDRSQTTVALQNVMRLNAVTQSGSVAGSAVTGAFTAGKVTLFVRDVSVNGNPFVGNFYGAICRFGSNSGTDIANMENWVGARTGLSL